MFIFIKVKKLLMTIIIFAIIILMISFSDTAYTLAKNAFTVWINNIVPSLLPFLICISLLKQTYFIEILGKILTPIVRPIFNLPGCGAFAITLGIVSGYPVGAKLTTELYKNKNCSKIEAERLLAFANTSGPLFIISSIGIGMFNNKTLGFMLLLTHLLGSLTVGVIFRNYKKKADHIYSSASISHNMEKINRKETLNANNLGHFMGIAIKDSISTLTLILGYIMFFSIILGILKKLHILSLICNLLSHITVMLRIPHEVLSSIVSGSIEMTNGIIELSSNSLSDSNTIYVSIAFLLGIAGFSVLMQTCSIISDTDLSIKPYIIRQIPSWNYFIFLHVFSSNIN